MIGNTVSHYKILEKLGEGGMGVVYKAQDTKLDRFVALKFLPPHIGADEEEKKRFIHEAKAASKLDHTNICTVHEIDETKDGRLFIVMGYYEGETLKQKIARESLNIDQTLRIVGQIAKGLEKAHKKGIVHRDIKPANIMITHDGEIKILDFGLAKLSDQTKLTKTGTTVGTVSYMSPEQTTGEPVDHRTDIWALGVLLYEMFAEDRPFKGDYEQAVIYSIMHEEPLALREVNPDVTPELEGIVHRALAKPPPDRYQNMEDLRADLEAVIEGRKPVMSGSAGRRLFGSKRNLVYAVIGVLTFLFILNMVGLRDRLFRTAGLSGRVIRLAVLPFANLSNDAEQEYFSDGITHEMINELGRLHPENLSVIGRTSVMRYKNTETPVDQIGQELGVDYVLEGSVQREAERVRIMAELVKVKDQTTLWGESFDQKLSGILTLQSEVAEKVAKALALRLLPDEKNRLTTVRTVNPEAHDAYLKGTIHWNKLTRKDIEIAEHYFNLALEKDSTYAPIYEGLAFVWTARQQMGIMTMREAGPKAIKAALKAVSLDDNSAEAHHGLAVVKSWIEWDWEGAEPEWRRTLELNPNHGVARAYYAHFLALTGYVEKSIKECERALELDPYNPLVHSLYTGLLNYVPRYNDAEAAARTTIALQPDAPVGNSQLVGALLGQGRIEEVIAIQREWHKGDPELGAAYEKGLKEAGYRGAKRRTADILAARYDDPGRVVRAETVGGNYFEAGDYEQAIKWFEKALENHEGNLPYITRPHYYNILRSNPRYLDILRAMGVPVEW